MTAKTKMRGLLGNSITEPCGLLCCAFGIKNSVAKIYLVLTEEPLPVDAVAAKVARERSVVQRYLQELVDNNLAIREVRSLERGGYQYLYRRNSSEVIRKQILTQLDNWYRETRKYLLETWPAPIQ